MRKVSLVAGPWQALTAAVVPVVTRSAPRAGSFDWLYPLTRLLLCFTFLASVVASLSVAQDRLYADRIAPGVHVEGVDLSGLSLGDARRLLGGVLDRYAHRPVVFTLPNSNQNWQGTPDEFGVRFDLAATLAAASGAGREGGPLARLGAQFTTRWQGQALPIVARLDDRAAQTAFDSFALEVNRPITNAGLRIDNGNVTILRSAIGLRLDWHGLAQRLLDQAVRLSDEPIELPMLTVAPSLTEQELAQVQDEARLMMSAPITLTWEKRRFVLTPDRLAAMVGVFEDRYSDGRPVVRPRIDPEAAINYGRELGRSINQEPREGRYRFQNGKFVPIVNAVTGLAVEAEKLPALLTRVSRSADPAERILALPMGVYRPAVDEGQLNTPASPLRERVGTATLFYSYSNPDRAYNIEYAARLLDGLVVRPGENFSFNGVIGDTTKEKGWRPGWAIVNERYVIDYGGGVCQVATTLFQAVYFAGYQIEERTNHAIRITAYEPRPELAGVDATVYYPYVDFAFRNNSDTPLLLNFTAGGGRIAVDLYGTPPNWTVKTFPPEFANVTDKRGVDILNRRVVTDSQGRERIFNLRSHFISTEG